MAQLFEHQSACKRRTGTDHHVLWPNSRSGRADQTQSAAETLHISSEVVVVPDTIPESHETTWGDGLKLSFLDSAKSKLVIHIRFAVYTPTSLFGMNTNVWLAIDLMR